MGFSSTTFTSFIECTPVHLNLSDEPNVGPLSGDILFVRKATHGGLTIDAGCDKHGGNVIHVQADTTGRIEKVMCPSFGGNGTCLLSGDRVCPNRLPTSKLQGQD